MKKIYLLLSLILVVSCSDNTGGQVKEGVILNFEELGFFWDSWEGTLDSCGTKFNFSFDSDRTKVDSALIEKTKKLKGKKVKLYYHGIRGWNWFNNRGLTGNFVDSVIPIPEPKQKPEIKVKDTIYVIPIKEEI